jgi:hypothetical protein
VQQKHVRSLLRLLRVVVCCLCFINVYSYGSHTPAVALLCSHLLAPSFYQRQCVHITPSR